MTGRRVGTRHIGVDQIETIVDLSMREEMTSRSFIADEAGVGKKTVYNYQRKFDLV